MDQINKKYYMLNSTDTIESIFVEEDNYTIVFIKFKLLPVPLAIPILELAELAKNLPQIIYTIQVDANKSNEDHLKNVYDYLMNQINKNKGSK